MNEWILVPLNSVQFSSVAQSCLTLCDPINCSMPGLPVHHQLLEFTQTHVHRVRDAIQPSHPLLSPSPPALNPSQHQRSFLMSQLFASGGQRIGASALASVLPMNIQDWFPLGLTDLIISHGYQNVMLQFLNFSVCIPASSIPHSHFLQFLLRKLQSENFSGKC